MATPTLPPTPMPASPRLADPSAASPRRAGEASGGPSFGALLKDARRRGQSRPAHKSDAQTQALAAGKANMVDVVTAVAETEVAIETLVSVRDKVISAYEEIMRMPI